VHHRLSIACIFESDFHHSCNQSSADDTSSSVDAGPIRLRDETIRARIQLFPAKPNLDPARRYAKMRLAYNVRSYDGGVQVFRLDEIAPSDFIIVRQTEAPIFWHTDPTKVPRSVRRAPVEIGATTCRRKHGGRSSALAISLANASNSRGMSSIQLAQFAIDGCGLFPCAQTAPDSGRIG
jgi:hypothetical protein